MTTGARYRLAWLSARRRAAGLDQAYDRALDRVLALGQERDALQAKLDAVQKVVDTEGLYGMVPEADLRAVLR